MSAAGHNRPPVLGDGWIARHRSVRHHWLVGHGIQVKPADPTRKRCSTQGEAWEDLLMECRYEDGTVSNGGVKMELRRGELIGAVSWLAHRWNWTPKTVRRYLDQLENDEMITLRNPASEKGNQIGRQANVITVCNYDVYQGGGQSSGHPEGRPEGDQRATTGRPEGNNIKNNKETREQGNNPNQRQDATSADGEQQSTASADPNASVEHVHAEIVDCEPPKGGKRGRAKAALHEMPVGWTPGDDGHAYAVNLGLSSEDIGFEWAKFQNYYSGEKKKDWPATWRNWCLNAAQRQPRPVRAAAQHDGGVIGRLLRKTAGGPV